MASRELILLLSPRQFSEKEGRYKRLRSRSPEAGGVTVDISQRGLRLIQKHEGLRLKAYRCPAGVWTIGWGHTGKDVRPGRVITKDEAEALLRKDLDRFEEAVDRAVKVEMTQPQFDALVSFAYNVGEAGMARSTVVRRLNAGNEQGAADALMMWVKAKGKTLPGLVRRRKEERKLFLENDVEVTEEDIARDNAPDMPQGGFTPDELKPLVKSKEMLTGGVEAVTGAAVAGAGLFGALGALPQAVQIGVIVVAVVLVAGGGFLMWNRMKAREAGER
jgi:lysozyme